MSSCLIPIATNVGESKYILGDIGKIINPQSKKELQNAIENTLELDQNSFENKKKMARMRIVKNFSQSKMISAYNKLYTKLINQ